MVPVRVSSAGLARAYELLSPDFQPSSLEVWPDPLDAAGEEGLLELALREAAAIASRIAAIERLSVMEKLRIPWRDLFGPCLVDPSPAVRLAAIAALGRVPRESWMLPAVLDRLSHDPHWPIRAKAIEFLGKGQGEIGDLVMTAADDPHWRVRNALIQVCCRETDPKWQDGILTSLDRLAARCRFPNRPVGVRAYLQWLWKRGTVLPELARIDPRGQCPFWDWDDAVLARHIGEMSAAERQDHLTNMPFLLAHDEPRVHSPATETLRRQGKIVDISRCLPYLEDPRHGAHHRVLELFARIDADRLEATVAGVLQDGDLQVDSAAVAWALSQVGSVVPWEEVGHIAGPCFSWEPEDLSPLIVAHLIQLAVQFPVPRRKEWLEFARRTDSPEVQGPWLRALQVHKTTRQPLDSADQDRVKELVRSQDETIQSFALRLVVDGLSNPELTALDGQLQTPARMVLAEALAAKDDLDEEAIRALQQLAGDRHPHVRAAALSPQRATDLLRKPDAESSWYVLQRAARLCRMPLWKIATERSAASTMAGTSIAAEVLSPLSSPATANLRRLGPSDLLVSPLALTGHYGLPERGFAHGVAAGVNLFFWEPNYATLTRFTRGLSPQERGKLHFIAGTFEAEPERIERDVERALRNLHLERLSLFMMFWVRSASRIPDEVRNLLIRLREQGKIEMFGLSTHDRRLALDAMDRGWNPLMVRHSAAHCKAELEIFPRALHEQTSVITFSNTCYGRLARLIAQDGLGAADCYRYSLAQPGVTTCLCAPATLEQLTENLQALANPELSDSSRRILLERGKQLYADESAFRQLVHSQ